MTPVVPSAGTAARTAALFLVSSILVSLCYPADAIYVSVYSDRNCTVLAPQYDVNFPSLTYTNTSAAQCIADVSDGSSVVNLDYSCIYGGGEGEQGPIPDTIFIATYNSTTSCNSNVYWANQWISYDGLANSCTALFLHLAPFNGDSTLMYGIGTCDSTPPSPNHSGAASNQQQVLSQVLTFSLVVFIAIIFVMPV